MFPPAAHDADGPIRATDNDAAVARLSAVQKGYFEDPFIKYLVPRAHLQPARPPLINVGTFVRSTAIDDLVDQWLDLGSSNSQLCQVISLGAGSDTRFWRISLSQTGPRKDKLGTYIEMDFPEITSKKAMAIRKSKDLSAVVGEPSNVVLAQGGTALHSSKYHLLPVDLRLPPSETMQVLLTSITGDKSKPLLSPSLSTLLIFECVLVYMTPAASSELLKWFVNYFSGSAVPSALGCVIYEMFGLNDAFGRVMVNNLKSRNVNIPGAEPFPTLETLPSRFLQNGFTSASAFTLKDIRKKFINSKELQRISKLEMLDEIEEMELLLQHYAISWGLFLSSPDMSQRWDAWKLKSETRNSLDEDEED